MKNNKTINLKPELDGWDEIYNLAGSDNIPNQNQINIKTSHKNVQAMSNLSDSIFSMQKALGNKLDELSQKIDEANKSSAEQSRRMSKLTTVIAIAALIQAFATLVILFK